jgi:hypothetical protein
MSPREPELWHRTYQALGLGPTPLCDPLGGAPGAESIAFCHGRAAVLVISPAALWGKLRQEFSVRTWGPSATLGQNR